MMITGLSGNEIYCLAQKGFVPGNIVLGNSVQSLGMLGGISSGLQSLAGGEITNITQLITEGRHAAIKRMEDEATARSAHGITGVTSELKTLSGMQEFIAVGSAVTRLQQTGPFFTTACSGQDLFCQIDAGFEPRHFVIGNVAYSIGLAGGFKGLMQSMAGGEVREYSQMYNHTRHLALERLEKEAADFGANAVVDIQTKILAMGGTAREMLMVGTASHHAFLPTGGRPVTSELTGEELWNLAQLGYAPLRLVLGTSVYSLGIRRGIGAFLSGFSRGEVNELTKLIYQARENCLAHIHEEATAIGADGVVGVKLFIHEMGGSFVEVMAIGTAIKKNSSITTASATLPAQAVIRDRDTFINTTMPALERNLQQHSAGN